MPSAWLGQRLGIPEAGQVFEIAVREQAVILAADHGAISADQEDPMLYFYPVMVKPLLDYAERRGCHGQLRSKLGILQDIIHC